jgi:hypothetical protein
MRTKPNLMILTLVMIIATAVLPAAASAANHHGPPTCVDSKLIESFREMPIYIDQREGREFKVKGSAREARSKLLEYPRAYHCRFEGPHYTIFKREVNRVWIWTPQYADEETYIVHEDIDEHYVKGPHSYRANGAGGGREERVLTPACGAPLVPQREGSQTPPVPCAPARPIMGPGGALSENGTGGVDGPQVVYAPPCGSAGCK